VGACLLADRILSGTIRLVPQESKPVYWISDAHLGGAGDSGAPERALVGFLARLRGQAAHLYVLGDLFDFWFEYRHAIPKGHFRALRALAELIDSGVGVTYLGGNHDFWCGSYLRREVGLQVHQRPITVEHQSRRIFLAHGDGFGSGDAGYRALKAVLRHPLAIALYRSIHPDIGIPLAHRISAASRKHTKPRRVYLERLSRFVAAPQFACGHDAVVVGHVHDPMHLRDRSGRDFIVIGDWIEAFSYARLSGGVLSLQRFRPDEPELVVPPAPWPEGIEP
jgi:UDP-2,3-diacylglucosamine hydrolase